jgi:hypothetical protein
MTPPEPLRLLDEGSAASEALRQALREERAALTPAPEQLDALSAALAPVWAGAAGSATAAAKGAASSAGLLTKGLVVKVLVVAAVGGGTVGTWKVVHAPAPSAPVARLAPAAPVPSAPRGAVLEEAAAPLPTVTPPQEHRPRPSPALHASAPFKPVAALPAAEEPSTPPVPAPTPAPLPPSELELLRQARLWVATRPAQAISLLDAHQAAYPHGNLEQEREVVAIDALMRLHREADARQRAEQFRQRFPDSAYLRRIDVLLGGRAEP